MDLYNLIVETTRRCNMKCPHCIRGKAQNRAMPIEHLRAFLQQIKYISCVTFTGGEPTLPSGIKVMYNFMDVCNALGVTVGSFYMVTNAKVWRPDIAIVVGDLYHFCDDNEATYIDISTDQYHDEIASKRRWFKYELEEALDIRFGIEGIVGMRENIRFDNVISEGNAHDWGTGRYMEPQDVYLEYWDDDQPRITEGDIYINCDGNIINGCDWSYESQKRAENIICSVTADFEKAVKKIAVQQELA